MTGIVLLAVTAAIMVFALWPLFTRRHVEVAVSPSDTPLGRLELRKDILLGNITDIDFEHAMGKIGESDYQSLRETLKRQASLVLEQIHVLHEPEAAAAQASEAAPAVGRPATGVARFCSQCGGKLPTQARFCPACGSPVVS